MMNRHTSNPFLAGWEENDDVETPNVRLFDRDKQGHDDDSRTTADVSARRHSSSDNSDTPGNPFGDQRAADRRLYHRNMSSFEVASLQLEQQQQQLQDNGSTHQSANQTDLIAKMTADFQTAIETNDKQFHIEGEPINEGGIELSAFDPFETIVDDDISIPSPATSLNQVQSTENFFKSEEHKGQKNNDGEAVDRPELINIESQRVSKNVHDSIDDDEDELVSTPVRNIKSSPQDVKILKNSTTEDGQKSVDSRFEERLGSSVQLRDNMDSRNIQSGNENSDSMAKASLFASLLASAETGQQGTSDKNANPEGRDFHGEIDQESSISPLSSDNPTHVIKGSSTAEGNVGRPVSFFDPFEAETVEDTITSLVDENEQLYREETKQLDDDLDPSYPLPARVPDPTPIHRSQKAEDEEYHLSNNNSLQSGHIAESASIETVIENTSSPKTNKQDSDSSGTVNIAEQVPSTGQEAGLNLNETARYTAVPRPTKSSNFKVDQQTAPSVQDPTRATPARSNKQKKKLSPQDDSSDSSDDDDRIQIVIRARDVVPKESHAGPTIVPLLPPPPSKSSIKQARERGQVEDMPSPVMSYKTRHERKSSDSADSDEDNHLRDLTKNVTQVQEDTNLSSRNVEEDDNDSESNEYGQFVIPMTHSDEDGDNYAKPDTPLYDEDTSYDLEDFPPKYEGSGWEMMLRYPPKKKLTSNRFWKKIFVKLAQVPLAPEGKSNKHHSETREQPQTCIALQIFDRPDDKKPMQEIPIQVTYTVSEISSQQFDQFGKIFTLKLQYIFYKERVGVRQGQLARFIHTGQIGSSTTSGGHGADPISIGAIKRLGAPIEHSPQISQIIKLGCTSYSEIKQFKNCLEDYLFKMPISRDRALSTYKTEEVQMAVRDETYLELNQVGTVIRQLARVRLFFLSFLNGTPTVEVGINDFHRQGREVVGRMDILPVVTEEWIRLEAWELHSTVDKDEFENPDSRIIKLVPPDATFFELMRFRIRPPRNRELPLQISANMSVTRTKVSINCDVMVPGCVSRKHGQIPCEGIAIRINIPECWIYFFREEKHFRMGSKKSVNRRPGKVKGIERFLGGGGLQDINDESSLIEVTSGQAKYEHHHQAIVWRAARWPKESQSAYVQNTMKIRLPLTAYDKMPDSFYEYIHVEYTMPATTVSHTTLRSISVNPCDDEPPEKYVKYSAKYEYKVKMRLSVNLGTKPGEVQPEASPIIIMKQPDLQGDLQREEDSDDDDRSNSDEPDNPA